MSEQLNNTTASNSSLEPTETTQDTSAMYLDQIKNLKANTVSKDDYNKLLTENRNLLQTIVEGKSVSSDSDQDEPKLSTSELAKQLCSGNLNNLDYIKTSLEHRKRMIEEKGIDPYLGISHTTAPTDEQIASANQVAEFLQDLVDSSNGNSIVFTNEYQRLVGDNVPSALRRGY